MTQLSDKDHKAQMEDMIHRLLRTDYQLLLIYRYLEGMTWEEIGDLLHVEKTTAKRWHKTALSLLQMPENPIFIKDAPVCTEMHRDAPCASVL